MADLHPTSTVRVHADADSVALQDLILLLLLFLGNDTIPACLVNREPTDGECFLDTCFLWLRLKMLTLPSWNRRPFLIDDTSTAALGLDITPVGVFLLQVTLKFPEKACVRFKMEPKSAYDRLLTFLSRCIWVSMRPRSQFPAAGIVAKRDMLRIWKEMQDVPRPEVVLRQSVHPLISACVHVERVTQPGDCKGSGDGSSAVPDEDGEALHQTLKAVASTPVCFPLRHRFCINLCMACR